MLREEANRAMVTWKSKRIQESLSWGVWPHVLTWWKERRFNEVDTNNTGRISEREFVEYRVHHKKHYHHAGQKTRPIWTNGRCASWPIWTNGGCTRRQYQYTGPYDRHQPFLLPTNAEQEQREEFVHASAIFRSYDRVVTWTEKNSRKPTMRWPQVPPRRENTCSMK